MHSTPAAVTPDSESPPEQPGAQPEETQSRQADPGLTDSEKTGNDGPRPRRLGRWMVLATVAAVLVAILSMLSIRSKTPATGTSAVSVSTTPGQVLRLKGTTEAVQSRAILAPQLAGQSVPTLTIIHLTPAGTRVKKGDLLVEFDRQAQMRDFVDKQADYAKLVDQVAEEQAKENTARAKDETELKAAEDSLRKAELEMQKAEIVSRIDKEKNQENLDEAKATFEQLHETFDLKRAAAQAGIRILEIQRDRTQQTMLHAQANSDLMQIRSPLDGVVVLNTIWKQGTMGEVQEGDQVRPGVPFMQVVNPAAMQVRVLANQQDFPSLQVGQTAKVRLDAYPDLVFSAKLDQLAPIGEGGDFSNKLRSFVVIVAIEGNNPKLMPDLSAAVDVDVAKQNAGSSSGSTSGSGS
ncbi:MAG: efflux RND transporter periplasmic adaptor subunit [Candidatus Sulfotelmatobacter sp.]